MNQLLLRSATICAALGLALPGSAQDDNSAQPYRTLSGSRLSVNHALTPIHTGVGEEGIPYGIWGAGDRYKVSFHDGATFVPYLGRDYPTNQPLRWRTLSAKVGDQELATVSQSRVTYDGLRAEFELGAIVEAYDIRAEGLEQTFVISARPEVAGDLVIRGTLDTALVADPRGPEHAGIEFRDTAGVPILSYGAATAIDAAGRSVTMTTAFEDGQVTLRLDAGFVETATYPLVVDPLLGVIYSIGGSELGGVDLVRDPFGTSRNIWRAATRFTSANDGDLYLRRFSDDGSSDLAMFSDLSTSWSSVEVSLGKHVDTGKILLGFTRLTTTGNSYARLHLDRRNNVTFGSSILSIPTGAGHNWRTDVASELGTAFVADYLLVVYQRDVASSFANTQTSQIWGVAVDVSGNGSVGTPFAIADEPFEDYERPTVGKHRFGTQEWAVANQVIGNSPALSPHVNWDIELRVVERTGGISAPTNIGVGDSQHQMAPRLAGVNDLQFVAYTRSAESVVGPRPADDNGMAVITERREWNGISFVKPYGGYMHAANQDPRVVLTGIDFDSETQSHCVMTYRSNVTERVYVRSLGYRAHRTRQETVYAPSPGEVTLSGAVAFDADANRFLLAYGVNGNFPGGLTHVDVFEHPAQIPPVVGGLGCSSATIAWDGSTLIGDDDCGVELSGLPAGALTTVMVATQPFASLLTGTPMVHPGCWLLVPNTGANSIGTLPIAFGPNVRYQVDLPEWLGPMTLHFQGVHFDAAATEVFTTQRLSVSFVK